MVYSNTPITGRDSISGRLVIRPLFWPDNEAFISNDSITVYFDNRPKSWPNIGVPLQFRAEAKSRCCEFKPNFKKLSKLEGIDSGQIGTYADYVMVLLSNGVL